MVTATLNRRIRNCGLSAKEIVLQRDELTGQQLNFNDTEMADRQRKQRENNHKASAGSQASRKRPVSWADVCEGSLIYVKPDGDKHKTRDQYIVISKDDDYVYARKFVGSQFRSQTYKLKYSEIYPVPISDKTNRTHSAKHQIEPSYDSDVTSDDQALPTAAQHDESSDSSSDNTQDIPPLNVPRPVRPQSPLPPAEDVVGLRPPPVPPDSPARAQTGSSSESDGVHEDHAQDNIAHDNEDEAIVNMHEEDAQDNVAHGSEEDAIVNDDREVPRRFPRRRRFLPHRLRDYHLGNSYSDSSDS